MANLRREPSQFFLFFLVAYLTTMVMSLTFRIIAALTKSISQAMTIAGVIALAIVVYSGFIIPVPSMHPWFGWIRWINPLYYAFEMFITNEFHGRRFTCSARIPAYSPSIGSSWICNVRGSVAGEDTVSGDAYITAQYGYEYEHMWRNLGILIAFLVGFLIIYLVAIELNSNTTSAAEVLIFKKRKGPKADNISKEATLDNDIINGLELDHIDHSHTTSPIRSDSATKEDVFAWQNVVYDIPYQGQQRRLLDHVTGWVKPGTLTALMGNFVSIKIGLTAAYTIYRYFGRGQDDATRCKSLHYHDGLLILRLTDMQVLAQRVSLGVVTGDMLGMWLGDKAATTLSKLTLIAQ